MSIESPIRGQRISRCKSAVDGRCVAFRAGRARRLPGALDRIRYSSMTHVAFVRAVNVGGTGIVKMADLQKAFTAAGCRNVRTFIASGNVLFDAPGGVEALRPRILKRVGALMGAQPVIVFRTLREIEAIVKAAPFGALADEPAVKLYVMFMAAKPPRKPAFPL